MMPFLEIIKQELLRFRGFIYRRVYYNKKHYSNTINDFHKLYYNSEVWTNTYWFGTKIMKCPLDLHIYQELLYKLKPEVVIETGTAYGGSALFFAHILDLIGSGEVITIDMNKKEYPSHKRITYLRGLSTQEEVVHKVKSLIRNKKRVMAFLDSDHSRDTVLKELNIYSRFITKGSYIVVEDTNLNGNPVVEDFGPGPMEAVSEFLKANKQFRVDNHNEKFYLTFNPKGFLKRVR